jgi:PKD repeat protein
MRSIRLMAVSTLILAGAWACGGDSGVGPNTPPVAAFTAPSCAPTVPCQFTDASTDADGTISTRSWDFGDASAAVPDQNPLHSFGAAGTFQVKLTVTDNNGATGTVTNAVTVAAGNNVLPTASFDLPPAGCTAGTPCGFHSTSSDPDGQVVTWAWNFGDLSAAGTGADATHTYAAAGTFPVTLTVTDNAGGEGTVTQQLNVSPAASQDCTTSTAGGKRVVDCSLTMTARVTVKIAVVSRSCELGGNKLSITAPRPQTAFFNLCSEVVGTEYTITNATGGAQVFEQGSTLALRFTQGTADPGDPASGDPGIEIDGGYPGWTLNVDDGGNAGAQGEPDFNDAVLSVTATLAP